MFLHKENDTYRQSDTQKIVVILKGVYKIPAPQIPDILAELYDGCLEYLSSKTLLGAYTQGIAQTHNKKRILQADDILHALGENLPKLYFATIILDLEEIIQNIITCYHKSL